MKKRTVCYAIGILGTILWNLWDDIKDWWYGRKI